MAFSTSLNNASAIGQTHSDDSAEYLSSEHDDNVPLMSKTPSQTEYGAIGESEGSDELVSRKEWIGDTNSLADQYSEDVLILPEVVRETVPLEDNSSVPVLTVRYFLLATLFVIPGAFIDTMNSFRTTSAPYSIFFVQIAAHWMGKWLANTMPKRRIKVFKWLFDLNPGPWSIKETAMVTITANSGATGNLATNAFALADLHFNESISPWVALPFMWAIVFVGYSYAAIAKPYLVPDTQFTFPKTLMKTALLQSQAESHSAYGKKQMKVFFIILSAMAIWQLFPEFIFPMTSSIAVLCYMAPYDETVNFIGSGLGGMGVLNFSLDWANITSSIMLYPYWIQVIQLVGFVLGAYILIPLVKFSNLGFYKDGLMSNRLFTSSGQIYPTEQLLTPDLKLNVTAYEALGPVHLGSQRAWNMFFDYAAYISGVVWVVLFGYKNFKNPFSGEKHVFTDRLNALNRKYKDVPTSWYITLFLVSFGTLLTIFISGNLFLDWKYMIVTLILGAIIVFPLSWLYAISNFQLAIGTFNELFYGYMVENKDQKHPVSALVFGSIAGDAWYRAQYHLEVMKLGFYNHLPPRAVFFSQLYGELIGIPVNYVALKWVLRTKRLFLTGEAIDPLHQWTGQAITSSHSNAIQYVVLGPSRLFTNYPWLPYGFLLGIVGPFTIYYLSKRFPNSKLQFHLWNTTVFFSTMSTFYGNISTGYLSRFLGGTVTMFYGFRYRHSLWKKYNYIAAAALDTGYNLSVVFLFLLLTIFPTLTFPHWWGNNAINIERCFAMH